MYEEQKNIGYGFHRHSFFFFNVIFNVPSSTEITSKWPKKWLYVFVSTEENWLFSGGTAGYQIYENVFKKIDISGIQSNSTSLLGF